MDIGNAERNIRADEPMGGAGCTELFWPPGRRRGVASSFPLLLRDRVNDCAVTCAAVAARPVEAAANS